MDVTHRRAKLFDAGSPVTRYWLARCVGFSITGAGRGRVEAVLSEHDSLEPETIVVRRSRRRLRRVPASAVVAVVPGERRLVLAQSEHRRPELPNVDLRPALAALDAAAVLLGRFLVWASAQAWWRSRRAWDVGAPVVARWSSRAWAEAVRLVASVPWHRFGPSVRSATTKASLELSRRWSLLRTTSSPPSSAADSPVEANTTSSG